MDGQDDRYPPTIESSKLGTVSLAVFRPSFWMKFLLIGGAALLGAEVAGFLGLVGVAALIGLYHALRIALREGWKASPVAVAIIVLGVIFMGLFFVHYNGLTCAVKGGWVIEVGDGNSLCIGPS